ncbi:hypothetical protein [Evansella cellulosilytica]|uniref:Uncharacterized protein n=1 Tax=Evansella cellulosilytica (strain ATCC 21833 / DSM 2522 / FERM P-1141 / JCM 9156 / N-4) TaxID=649639 RepID=E6U0N3_EVAC2|nr:hypothetical protein [Evansella cellulosilytica]ADU29081.1 hypothetical protein Bcell_0800 [Evansella cellulosilytica DSM 2522]
MLKKVIAVIVIVALIVIGVQAYLENERQRDMINTIQADVLESFKPLIENTGFVVNDDMYYSIIDSVEFLGETNSTISTVQIHYNFYKNELSEDGLLITDHQQSSTRLSVDVERDTSDDHYTLAPSHQSYAYTLYENFISALYDYHYIQNNEETWAEKGSSSTYNEDDIEIDRNGLVISAGNVSYSTEIEASNQLMYVETEFTLQPHGEPMTIPLNITFPVNWDTL